jgi:hypothetical protein
MARDRFFSTGIGLLVLATCLVSNTVPALATSKIVVDDDRVQCPQAGFTTIQSAIDSLGANPTGTITVCAGSYKESITIALATKLKLIGKPGAVIIPEFIPNNSTVVSIQFSTDFTMRGFTIDGLGNDGTADNGDAVALEFFHSSGTIQDNTIRNWHTLNFATTANGLNAIHLINGQGESVKVLNNTITQFQTTAILAEGLSTLKIAKNDITTTSTPANTATGIAIRATGSGSPVGTVTGNSLTSDSFPGGFGSIGIRVDETGHFIVAHNTLSHWDFGMYLPSFCTVTPHADSNRITDNTIKDVSIGIEVESFGVSCDAFADNDRISSNKITNTVLGDTGIFIRARGISAHGSAQNELVTGNTITHFSDPLSHTAEANGAISGVFDPDRIVP